MVKRGKIVALLLLTTAPCLKAAGTDALRWQFHPEIGKKQTMQTTTRLTTTYPKPPGQDSTEFLWIFTAELEPIASAADGSVTLRVALLRVQEKSSLASHGELFHFDTAAKGHELDASAGQLVAFLGESFTAVASAQGAILQLDTENFYRAVAENRIKHEDQALRTWADAEGGRRYKNLNAGARHERILADGEKAVREANEKYGSREQRKQAYKAEAAESNYYGTRPLQRLLNDLLPLFAAGPVRPGDHWTGPVLLLLEGPMELAGTYTFQGQDSGVGTIAAEATRNMNDRTIGARPVQESQRVKLAGAYHATIKVDPTTGCLRSKDAVMDLQGTTPRPNARTGQPGDSVPITTKATITVEVIH